MRKTIYYCLLLCGFIPVIPLFGEITSASLQTFPSMEKIYHPVSTTNAEAQKSFDIGLTYLFAFNHDYAFHAFETASKLDPDLAMAYWGMAMALGQNVNEDVNPEREILSYRFIQKALQLSQNASQNEKDYINAASVRYTNDPDADFVPLRFKYRDAMKKVTEIYPEDLDAAVLYAESILDLDPWKWWSNAGEPLLGTIEAIQKLQFVLSRNPLHIGANHFYIHAWEESPTPERALLEAYRLGSLLPESGHLVHMPCHIFIPTGDYESAANNSRKAIAQDRAYFDKYGLSLGMYPIHYLSHNLAIYVRVNMLQENYDNAIRVANELVDFVTPYFDIMPDRINLARAPLEVFLYFHRWHEILSYRFTVQTPVMQAFWRYSRAKAFASLGNLEEAHKEQAIMNEQRQKITDKDTFSNSSGKEVLAVADLDLKATFSRVENRPSETLNFLKEAIALQDKLNYDEPPAWFYSLRIPLGAELLRQGKFVEAEGVFRQSLQKLQRNGRALLGLYLSLKGQERHIDAYWVEREMRAALKNASHRITLDGIRTSF